MLMEVFKSRGVGGSQRQQVGDAIRSMCTCFTSIDCKHATDNCSIKELAQKHNTKRTSLDFSR